MRLNHLNELYQDRKKQIIEEELPFPQMIRSLRQALGLKINAVSEFCGFSRHKLYRMETGQITEPPADQRVEKLAELYDIPVWLIKEKFYSFVAIKKGNRDAKTNVATQNDRGSGGRSCLPIPVSRKETRSP